MEHKNMRAPLEIGENKVKLDLESFESIDFDNFNFLFPPPASPLSPPTITEMHVDANLMPAQEDLQLSSLSLESDQTNDLEMLDPKTNDIGTSSGEKTVKRHHNHNIIKSRAMKKTFTVEKLAEIAATDPKKAKRILSNRKAAARSKEKRERHAAELEMKLESLLIKNNNLETELETVQNDNKDLEAENNIFKIKIETKIQEVETKQAFIELYKEQKQTLNILIQRNAALYGNNPFSGAMVSQFSSELPPQHYFPNIIQPHQLQQAPQQPQLFVPPPPPPPPPTLPFPPPPPFGEPFREHFFSLDYLN